MSTLEIILYSLLGAGTLAYVIYCIVKIIKGKKKKDEAKTNADDM